MYLVHTHESLFRLNLSLIHFQPLSERATPRLRCVFLLTGCRPGQPTHKIHVFTSDLCLLIVPIPFLARLSSLPLSACQHSVFACALPPLFIYLSLTHTWCLSSLDLPCQPAGGHQARACRAGCPQQGRVPGALARGPHRHAGSDSGHIRAHTHQQSAARVRDEVRSEVPRAGGRPAGERAEDGATAGECRREIHRKHIDRRTPKGQKLESGRKVPLRQAKCEIMRRELRQTTTGET